MFNELQNKSYAVLYVVIGLVFLASVYSLPVLAQEKPCYQETNGEVTKIVCPISEKDPYPLAPITVPNRSKVLVRITERSPFTDCVLTIPSSEPIKESDPIATILQLFTQLATGAKLPGQTLSTTKGADPTTLAEQLLENTKELSTDLATTLNQVNTLVDKTHKPLLKTINSLVADPPRSDGEYLKGTGPQLLKDLKAENDESEKEDSPTNGRVLDGILVTNQAKYDLIRAQLQTIPNDLKTAVVLNYLSLIAGQLSALRSGTEGIAKARAVFETVDKKLKQRGDYTINLELLPYYQETEKTLIVCTNSLTNKPITKQDIKGAISYRKSVNPISVSVGPLLSFTAKQKLGTTAVKTGVDSSGNPTFKSVFAVLDHAPVQLAPFAFFNYRITYFGKPKDPTKEADFSLHLTGGIGVNPNSGSNEVEYFVGPSIGYKRLFIHLGDHIGRFQKGFTGGFNIGDTVPASFPSALPIDKEYRHGFGIAVSYRLPL